MIGGAQMLLQRMMIFRSISAVCTPIGIDSAVGFHVTIEHTLVDTGIIAFTALEGFQLVVLF